MLQRLLIILIGYLIGSFQTAIVLGRMQGIDIRDHGSGNAGATNTLRVLGSKSAIIVFLGDMVKTILAILIVKSIFKDESIIPQLVVSIYAGIGAILGHNWPIYFQFKGGKGIAVSVSTLLMLDYRIGIIGIVIFLICVFITRYVSLSSILLTLSAPVCVIFFYRQTHYFLESIIIVMIIPVLAIYRHRSNIQRLLNGTESKLGQKNKDKE